MRSASCTVCTTPYEYTTDQAVDARVTVKEQREEIEILKRQNTRLRALLSAIQTVSQEAIPNDVDAQETATVHEEGTPDTEIPTTPPLSSRSQASSNNTAQATSTTPVPTPLLATPDPVHARPPSTAETAASTAAFLDGGAYSRQAAARER